MELRWIGRFRETSTSADGPSIYDVIDALPEAIRGVVADYLDVGVMIAAVPGLDRDVLAGPEPVLPQGLLTDGTYVWRRSLGHYVRAYGVEVPTDLIDRAVAGARPTPQLDPGVDSAVTEWLRQQIALGAL